MCSLAQPGFWKGSCSVALYQQMAKETPSFLYPGVKDGECHTSGSLRFTQHSGATCLADQVKSFDLTCQGSGWSLFPWMVLSIMLEASPQTSPIPTKASVFSPQPLPPSPSG